MSAATNLDPERIVRITCGVCAIPFGLVGQFYDDRRRDGKSFFCPNGHVVSWADNDHARTKRDLEAARQNETRLRTKLIEREHDIVREKERTAAADRSARSVRGHATRLRKRIAEGRCPCCAETFANVAEHIAAKHPKYGGGDE